MAQDGRPRRNSVDFPLLLITIGGLFLYANWRPSFDPWPVLWTYWPLILIFVGLGKMWDSMRRRQNPGAPERFPAGPTIGVMAFILVLLLLLWHGRAFSRRHGTVFAMQHQSRTVDSQGAKSVAASIDMGAGELTLSGGASHLLDADFDYRASSGSPQVDYRVSGTTGRLEISQTDSDAHFSTTSDNHWSLHFASDVPMELKVNMGAGQADVDLTGDRKADLRADIEGGVGEANIRLPKNVGVIVNASGGIGTIDTHGLKHDGDEYTNEAYGKSPVTIHLKVEGGIGRISLTQEP